MVVRRHLAPRTRLLWHYGVLENAFCHLGLWASCPGGLPHGGGGERGRGRGWGGDACSRVTWVGAAGQHGKSSDSGKLASPEQP